MSLETFFENLNLNIRIDEPELILNYRNMFRHFNNEYISTLNDIREELNASVIFETNTEMSPDTINKLIDVTDNDIPTLYNIIEPKKCCKRTRAVYIENDYSELVFTGAKQSFIDINVLQHWVNYFHAFQFENTTDKMFCGFILHLLYIRIHPHEDGNGRMSRYLFLENAKLEGQFNFCPLSKILNENLKLPNNDFMKHIYDWIDSTILNYDALTKESYYELVISTNILKRIYYVMYITICYKYFTKYCDISKQLFSKEGFKYTFCVCRQKTLPGKSTAILDIYGAKRMKEHIRIINQFLDYNTHKNLIREEFGII
jgi:hypothetical protein